MTGLLQHDDGDSYLKCYLCGGDAAGPCATCKRDVCGDCCVLVGGAGTQWAVCTRCETREGSSVGGWRGLAWLFLKVVLLLVALVLALAWLSGDL